MAAVHPDPDTFSRVHPGPSPGPASPDADEAAGSGKQPLKDRGSVSSRGSGQPVFELVHPGNAREGKLSAVRVFGKPYEVCWRSLFIFPVNHCFRQKVISLVLWKWFDRFILSLILVNSILLASYQYRANPGTTQEDWNRLVDDVLDPILTVLFTLEFMLKVIAWGFFLDKRSYLREVWNWLDFVVVVTALIAFIPGMDSGLGFLRLFRILRPLRSLKQVPKMKALVNTVISSIPRLGNVTIMMFFFFWIFGIIGITLLDGVFYHGCRTTPAPVLRSRSSGGFCWDWPLTGDARLCGGRYMCDSPPDGVSTGYCGGREDDPNEELRPVFPGGRQGYPWCEEPKKIFAETDFIHFDHMGGALLTVFQCMTMEGWTDIMYYIQDGFGFWVGTLYFFTLIPITSFFLLNLALAVVDEAREDFDDEDSEEEDEEGDDVGVAGANSLSSDEGDIDFMMGPDGDEELWLDHAVVRCFHKIAFNEVFTNFVMFFIAGNVVAMMLESYPPEVGRMDFLNVCEKVFLAIFCTEMLIMLVAMGPKGYVTNPVTCFDGFIVIISLVQVIIGGGGSAFTALRTGRLIRVLNKLAHRWPSFKVLLKAMVHTSISLNYWLVLFFLFLYIWTLMWMSFFNRQFHFQDLDSFNATSVDKGSAWCAGTEGEDSSYRQDCMPRAHFDTFLWAFVTIFQIMTGENWNWIMYAGMRAQHWIFAGIFIALIVFGQILFLSLFLSMLMSKFNKVQDTLERRETQRSTRMASRSQTMSHRPVHRRCLAALAQCLPCMRADAQEDSTLRRPSLDARPHPDGAGSVEGGANLAAERPHRDRDSDSEDEPSVEALPGQPDVPADQKVASPKKGDASKGGTEVSVHKPWQADEEDESEEEEEPRGEPRKDTFLSKEELAEAREQGNPQDGTLKGSPVDPQRGSPPSALLRHDSDDREPWPHGYAWFVLSEENPLRRGCRWVLSKQVGILGTDINAFDNLILVCILVSTVCMALDTPLRDPGETFTKVLRQMDFVFKIIFIVEMALKLLAMGLVWGRDAYLQSGWNWLDGIVVVVSIVGMVSSGSTGFLKTLRILRAFRPLRVISRNQNLKVVVQTIFASMPALVTLVIVCLVFLLIFALFALSYLNGTFYSCQAGDATIALEKDLGYATPATPLCLSPNVSETQLHQACPRGVFRPAAKPGGLGTWTQDALGCPWQTNASGCGQDLTFAWQRVSADTPICVGRCDVHNSGGAPEWLCPRRYTSTAELPHNCAGPRTVTPEVLAAEDVGTKYRDSMTRALVMPCGGTALGANGGLVEDAASAASCRATFCPGEIPAGKKATCKANCRKHPHFCTDKAVCADQDDESPKCQSCRKECEAACQCDGYCEPVIKDAALCHEQGGAWMPSLPQNFDNVWNSLLTLFEISSTEGWVDVMYAACDARQPYEEPKRDNQEWMFAPFFVFYIFTSFMFLLNLSVGVIVDNFIDLKESGNKVMLTQAQLSWIKSQKGLLSKAQVFLVRNLHLMPKARRRVYDIVASKAFEAVMTCIVVVNTMVMAAKVYPVPTTWWEDTIQVLDYIFGAIYCLEFVMKYYAFRNRYWIDPWNRFDFGCVLAALLGTILSFAAPDQQFVQSLSQIFRIFRIARLFRLLRTKQLNQIFMAFILSMPKLVNVLMVLLLLMILYGILGVSLFSTVKHSEWLNHHGNFMDFGWAFITLFRAVTGEAWNSIMHDLLKNEKDFFREGSWCAPDNLFDTSTEDNFNLLKSKCLIDQPNSCVQTIAGWSVFPVFYWVTYILFIQLMVMNLVIAVILEGYEDGKRTPESEVIDLCIQKWEKYDPDHKMIVPLPVALEFITEVLKCYTSGQGKDSKLALSGLQSDDSPLGCDLNRIPMHHAKFFRLNVTGDCRVDWLSASKQVLRFTCTEDDEDLLREVEDCENHMDKRLAARLDRLESKRNKMLGVQENNNQAEVGVKEMVAATKLQRYFRRASKSNLTPSEMEEPHSLPSLVVSQSPSAAVSAMGAPSSSMASMPAAPSTSPPPLEPELAEDELQEP